MIARANVQKFPSYQSCTWGIYLWSETPRVHDEQRQEASLHMCQQTRTHNNVQNDRLTYTCVY